MVMVTPVAVDGLSAETKRELGQKVVSSETFRKSDRLQKILLYLIEASIRSEVPKGVTIILEVFGKGALNSDNGTANIHANIYQLRKKLKDYYDSEGQNDDYIISLASGEYSLLFTRNQNTAYQVQEELPVMPIPPTIPAPERKFDAPKIPLRYMLLATLALVVVAMGIYWAQKRNSTVAADAPTPSVMSNPFWAELNQSQTKPIHLIVGAFNTYAKKDKLFESGELVFSNQMVSEEDEKRFADVFRGDSVHKNGSVIRNPGTVRNLYDMTLMLAPFEKRLNLTYSNLFSWDMVYNGDIIYVGGIPELYKFRHLFKNTRLSIDPYRGEQFGIKSVDGKDSVVLQRKPGEAVTEAYFFAQKLPTQDNNVIWILSGTTGTRDKSVKLFRQADFLAALEKLVRQKFGRYPPFFEVVLKFKLYAKAGFDYEVIFLNEISRKDLYSK